MAMWKLRLCLRRRKISSWRLKNNNLKRECVFNLPTRFHRHGPRGAYCNCDFFVLCYLRSMPSL